MSLGLSASVLVAPLLLIENPSSNRVLNGFVNKRGNSSLTAYEISGATASFVIGEAPTYPTTQTVPAATIIDNLSMELYPVASTLVYGSFSVIPADQIVIAETTKPNTLVAPAYPMLAPPLPPPPAAPKVQKVVAVVVRHTVPAKVTTPTTVTTPAKVTTNSKEGKASWYGAPTGTCANTWLPIGTVVTVTNLANHATTKCRVEDRGPYVGGRILDLSEGSFSRIASTTTGVINIRMQW